tara:strand:- start:200 stop:352 length:153 start_codon:yes stop_codon:yes gene_type:complete
MFEFSKLSEPCTEGVSKNGFIFEVCVVYEVLDTNIVIVKINPKNKNTGDL